MEEGLEDVFLFLGGHADAGIADCHRPVVLGERLALNLNGTLRGVTLPRKSGQVT